MARNQAPSIPTELIQLVDPQTGKLTTDGLDLLLSSWRQYVAGFVIVPAQAVGQNAIVLSSRLHQEGDVTYGEGMAWFFEATQTSDGAVTIAVGNNDAVKAYINNGATQAGSGDIVDDRSYLAVYQPTLDSGAGGFIIW